MSDDVNPFDGIDKVSNTWTSAKPTPPLTADWIAKGFEMMRVADESRREREAKIGAEYREAMKDPAFAARQDAVYRACIDVGCPFPNPLNPPMVSKAMYEAVNRRADEILAAKDAP